MKCSICDSEDYKGGTKTRCNRCRTNERRHKLKAKLVAMSGGECSSCGYDKCLAALCFKNLLDNKQFNVSNGYDKPWEILEGEVFNCILLCLNCNAETKHKSPT